MKFYFQLDGNVIRDAITYPYDGYTEVELDATHLPAGINAGYYRLQDGALVLDQALKDKVDKASRPADYVELEQRLAASEAQNKQLAEESNANQLALMELHMLVLSVLPNEG
ncbi:hypothetical protein HP548_02905 [Paenibacillus taichungensis]|uniref:Uncharacterized protein n=1 Tax=Paenibacillus taichungensis TaxID=484184 RepID=A0ABX2MDM6_9BACL|nr:hypothetical protein [Paenibacillus taichungensis]NUU53046.1 hypothetical protein [Paenibacillus taichungensis]